MSRPQDFSRNQFYSVIIVLDTYLNISLLDMLSVFSITCSYSLTLRRLKFALQDKLLQGGWLTQAGAECPGVCNTVQCAHLYICCR